MTAMVPGTGLGHKSVGVDFCEGIVNIVVFTSG
jgi:hypothetical protein